MTVASRFLFVFLVFLAGCATNQTIVNDVDEREANEIVVYLASKGIAAEKIPSPSAAPGGGGGPTNLWSITVPSDKMTESMAYLNQIGLPRIKGTDLLTLFAKQGLMTSATEETIRYQAGLAQQIANMIRKIDGVIDADVQLSFPPTTTATIGGPPVPQKVTAAVYVKHQGVLDDPNSHLVTKIKRLVAGSVNGLDVNDVTVIPDRSRIAGVTITELKEPITAPSKEYVSIWSIIMTKDSAGTFRFLFFMLCFLIVILALIIGWLFWKFYPLLREKGFKELLNPIPVKKEEIPPEEIKEEE
jgi:type III secretion protein J